jgi:hypothetical protein
MKPEIGMKIEAMFIELDRSQEKLILSQKRIFEIEVLQSLEVGQVVKVRGHFVTTVHKGMYKGRLSTAVPDSFCMHEGWRVSGWAFEAV